jgi:PAS domain S-box-containing protein
LRFLNNYSNDAFVQLPKFSKWLLDTHFEEFLRDQLDLSYELNLPLLQQLKDFSKEQLLELSRISVAEYLTHLAGNKLVQYLQLSIERWRSDQLEIVGKYDVQAEDITLISFLRNKSLRKYIPLYTTDVTVTLQLVEELDIFLTGSSTALMNTYIDLLKEQISRHEQNLLEAQEIALIGSFEQDLLNGKANNSPMFYKIFGLEKSVSEQEFLAFVHPDDFALVEHALQEAHQTGSYECEYRFNRNGNVKHIWSKGRMIYQGDKAVKFVGTIQDISERKLIEDELVQKTIALERSNESLQQFAFVASHDLKEPIRKIANKTDIILIKEQSLSDTARANIKVVQSYAVRLRDMIDDILAYSTLTQWEERKETNLNDIVNMAVENLEFLIEEKDAFVDAAPLPNAKVVPSQFRQLFQNLISNAIKFAKPGERSIVNIQSNWLTCEQVANLQLMSADKYLQIIVQDNGIGFDQEYAEKIFGLFNRLNRTDYAGSGIGLSIARRIIDNHGGVIYAGSQLGQGATFTMIIPQ